MHIIQLEGGVSEMEGGVMVFPPGLGPGEGDLGFLHDKVIFDSGTWTCCLTVIPRGGLTHHIIHYHIITLAHYLHFHAFTVSPVPVL